jgi:hypothetical protein
MELSGISQVQQVEYAVKVERAAQDAQRQEGEAALELIKAAAPDARPPVAPDGRGRILDTVI